MNDVVHGAFVTYKVSKIRWKPEMLYESAYFVTGSVEEIVNCLTLWYHPVDESDLENYPAKQVTCMHSGDVTEIKFVNASSFVVSSALGNVQLSTIIESDMQRIVSWDKLHRFRNGVVCPCTGLDCFEEDVVTIGEDGRINLLTLSQEKPIRVIGTDEKGFPSRESTDNCSLQCICFLTHNEILSGNIRGHMRLWDLRTQDDTPMTTFMLTGDQIATTCATVHPSQRHILLVGGEDGSIYVWDLRKSTHPINTLNAHKGPVREMVFHPLQPDHLFSCSAKGELLHWNTTKNVRDPLSDENVWLSVDTNKHKMEIFSLMPFVHKSINSLDITGSRLVCGCDNEAVYIVKDLP